MMYFKDQLRLLFQLVSQQLSESSFKVNTAFSFLKTKPRTVSRKELIYTMQLEQTACM